MAIRSAGGDSYVMANYLPVCLDPAVRIWLTSLLEESITSWGDLNKKLIESFQATYNRPGSHFDLTQIKQKTNEPLHDYIKQFCTKKIEIPNVPNQQIIAAFQGGIRSNDLVRDIDRRNHDLKLTAQECFEIADKFTSGESALDDIRGKGKKKRSDKPKSSKKEKKRKSDNAVHMMDRLQKNPQTNQPSTDELLSGPCLWHPKGNHKANDCYRLKGFATAALKVAKDPPRRNSKDKTKDDGNKDDSGEFQEPRKEVNFIFGGLDAYVSKRKQKMDLREINSVEPATPQFMRWYEMPFTFDRSDHPKHIPKPGRYLLVLAAMMKEVKFNKVLIDGGSSLDLIFTKTLKELGLSVNDLQPSSSPFHGIVPGKTSVPIGQVSLPVTFGTRENFKTEHILFQVVDFDSAYHAIIGRLVMVKFMAVPCYPYLTLKMPGPNGIISLHSDLRNSFDCDLQSCEMANKQLMLSDQKEIQKAVGMEEQTRAAVPAKKPSKDKI
ncbi:hypothetical protein PR202_gb07618 [Eleusine coracana subsp. coracana]|uniref:Retrotransposon gag domain-containing protein n=1 Tax=Eleusine coracana subsp. coracana TaxID=191504 RepID=A0AAV5EA59_ELECO|nr:hypothetical protein PR202_gb07618 [Eleusine coracana subsp. coracana]